MDAPYRIRPAGPDDAAALAALERRCFSDPWSAASFAETLVASWSFGLIAFDGDGPPVGYVVAREAAGSAEILNLAVAPEARGRGLGRQLLLVALERLTLRGAVEVYLEVRESNTAAQALYLSEGFDVVGRRKGYYRLPRENALVLRAALPRPAGNRAERREIG